MDKRKRIGLGTGVWTHFGRDTTSRDTSASVNDYRPTEVDRPETAERMIEKDCQTVCKSNCGLSLSVLLTFSSSSLLLCM